MSVLTSLAATPARIVAVATFVRQQGSEGVSTADLYDLLAPVPLRRGDAPPATINEVLNEAKQLGLITEVDGQTMPGNASPVGNRREQILAALDAILVDPVRAKEAGQDQVPLALAWLLTRDPAHPLRFDYTPGPDIREQFRSESSFELTNSSRFQNLVYWAVYLGYAWRASTSDSNFVVPDPTDALARLLPAIAGGAGVPIRDAIAALSLRSAVLDGGVARLEVDRMATAGVTDSETVVSRSTSLALVRLERRGVLELERKADAPVMVLDSWPSTRPVSHLRWTRAR